jgi:hypothetical protein
MGYSFKILINFRINTIRDKSLEYILTQLHINNVKVEYIAITEYKTFISSEASKALIMCNVGDFGKEYLEKLANDIPSLKIHINNPL